MSRITDRQAVYIALQLAIEYEESLNEAYAHMPDDDAVLHARHRIAAFKRVLDRYYPDKRKPKLSGKMVSIFELMKGEIQDFDPSYPTPLDLE